MGVASPLTPHQAAVRYRVRGSAAAGRACTSSRPGLRILPAWLRILPAWQRIRPAWLGIRPVC